MTKKLQTVFAFILLLSGINCTKESTTQSSVGANANQSPVAASSADNLSVNVVYELDFDWGCTGTVYNDYLTLHSDGTWTDGYYTGLWVREKTIFMFRFDGSETIYAGDIANDQVSGIMSTFNPGNPAQGCFTMHISTGADIKPNHPAGQPDLAGKNLPKTASLKSSDHTPVSIFASALAGNQETECDYSWGCTGFYNSTPETFYSNGTWSSGEGFTGLWVKGDNFLIFNFDGSETVYAGNIRHTSAAVNGIMSTFTTPYNYTGCFSEYASTAAKTKRVQGQPDASGK